MSRSSERVSDKSRVSRSLLSALLLVGAGGVGCHPAVRSSKGTVPDRTATAATAKGAAKPPAKDGDKDPETGLKKFSVLIAKSVERKGFFDTYQKGDDLFLAVPKKRLGEEFLLYARIARGVGQRGLVSGYSTDGREALVVAFERHGDRVFLVQRLTRVIAPAGSPLARAVEQSYSGSVLQSASVESERPDGAAVINIKGWLTGDLSSVGRLAGVVSRSGTGSHAAVLSPNRDRSYIESVKSFPDNLNLRASLTFTPTDPADVPTLANDRFLSVLVYYTFARLPAQPMVPRPEDDRIGYFVVTQLDPGSANRDFFVRSINRWRLQPADDGSEGVGSRPRRPIVFYIDPSVPVEYRPFVKSGVEAWGAAFAAAGWRDTIRAEPLPAGADPEDLRYPTIRWDVSVGSPLGRGELVADPRSGEILGASVTISMHLVRHFREFDLPYVGGGGRGESLGSPLVDGVVGSALRRPLSDAAGSDGDGADFGLHMQAQATLLHTSLLGAGVLLPHEKTPLRLLGQSIKFTAMHEVGHVLGLRHNFKSSTVTPLAKLGDMAWVREHGLVGSVMDYPGLNLPRGAAPDEWYYYPPGLGQGDVLTIRYGYTPNDAQAREVARQAAQSGHVFATDEDARLGDAVDPTVQDWDLSDDPLGWARERAAIIHDLWLKLPERVLADGEPYSELTEVFLGLLNQYTSTVDIAIRYVGGQFQARDHVGDPGGRLPYANVPKARQEEALKFLDQFVFSDSALAFPNDLLARLGPRGAHGFESHRPAGDVPVSALFRSLQGAMLGRLLSTDSIARLRNAEVKFGASAVLTLPELMERLTTSLWSELVGATPHNVGVLRRELQRRHLERLAQLALMHDRDREAGTDMHAVARLQLSELGRRLAGRERTAGLDAYTRAHIADTSARITKILDAHLVE